MEKKPGNPLLEARDVFDLPLGVTVRTPSGSVTVQKPNDHFAGRYVVLHTAQVEGVTQVLHHVFCESLEGHLFPEKRINFYQGEESPEQKPLNNIKPLGKAKRLWKFPQ